jgi:sarcosine oxidase/L-pipecolate oxidase
MRWLRARVEATGCVDFVTAEVSSLLYSASTPAKVSGVQLTSGAVMEAELVIVATGAWTPKLVDLRGRAQATGQVLMYMDLSAEEQETLGRMPVLLNMSSGMFIIPPRDRVLKVARHAYGYWNPTAIPNPNGVEETITVSLPLTSFDTSNTSSSTWVPAEGESACRAAVREMIPALASRPFTRARLCWYTDTAAGDFLISYHPRHSGLFVATGGSGHAYKFLPVIGERIVDCVLGQCPVEFGEKWRWPEEKQGVEGDGNRGDVVVTRDGSRGGTVGLLLDEESAKGCRVGGAVDN